MTDTLFVGGIADRQVLNVDDTKPVIVVAHPPPPILVYPPQRLTIVATKIRTDRYQRRQRVEPNGSLLTVYVYEGTDG